MPQLTKNTEEKNLAQDDSEENYSITTHYTDEKPTISSINDDDKDSLQPFAAERQKETNSPPSDTN